MRERREMEKSETGGTVRLSGLVALFQAADAAVEVFVGKLKQNPCLMVLRCHVGLDVGDPLTEELLSFNDLVELMVKVFDEDAGVPLRFFNPFPKAEFYCGYVLPKVLPQAFVGRDDHLLNLFEHVSLHGPPPCEPAEV
jgi:hypothetical protein